MRWWRGIRPAEGNGPPGLMQPRSRRSNDKGCGYQVVGRDSPEHLHGLLTPAQLERGEATKSEPSEVVSVCRGEAKRGFYSIDICCSPPADCGPSNWSDLRRRGLGQRCDVLDVIVVLFAAQCPAIFDPSVNGQVELPTGGQVEVPTPR